MISPELRSALRDLTLRGGYGEPLDVQPLTGGANNRVFRVEMRDGPALLKAYFHHPADPRDRLGSEFSFATFAWNQGIRSIPRPLEADPGHRLGLYEFIAGLPFRGTEPSDEHVKQAVDFLVELNRYKETEEARRLPDAAEACFSIDRHLELVDGRIRKLGLMDRKHPMASEAWELVETNLKPLWVLIRRSVSARAKNIGLQTARPLEHSLKCVSPSDFGFHNALVDAEGWIRFVDFEYAGWDDPAKMVCDFFCQPEVPVPMKYFRDMVGSVEDVLGNPSGLACRCELLMTVYCMKWSCIVLNEFVAVSAERRRFSRGWLESGPTLSDQVFKAREFIRRAREALP